MNRKSGFTLIELLVVIAIIAILAAILFPVFAQAREKARTVSCLSNTKQIGLAAMMYVQDYDETFFSQPWPGGCPDSQTGYWTDGPSQGLSLPEQHWATMLYPYTKNGAIFKCPSFSGSTYTASFALFQCGDPSKKPIVPESDYGLNEWIVSAPTTLASIGSPSETGLGDDNPYIFDGPSVCQDHKLYFINAIVAFGGKIDWWGNSIRHTQGNNFFFCDGHSKWKRPGGILPAGTGTYNANSLPADSSNPGAVNTSATTFGAWPVLTTDAPCETNGGK